MIDCRCGCGQQLDRYDSRGRERSYLHGHAGRIKRVIVDCICGCGETFIAKPTEDRKYIKNHQNSIVGFQTGYIPHNKGRSYIPKNIDQFIEGGKKTRFKKGQMSGKKHHNWAGGVTPERTKIRNSYESIQWRNSVFERDNYTCVLCKKRGGDLVADHIKGFALYPELRFDLDNGRTLCKDCNYISTYKLKEWKITNERRY